MIRFLFKQPQPKRFDYKPRYFNETKEYLEGRKAAIRQELDREGSEVGGEGMRSRMSYSWRQNQNKKATSNSNKNVFYIALILSAIAYFLLFG
ncbi:hypothetical protein N8Z47_05440 [Salibacteraceae bacterium]|nr:hypothetical protein [Salibacteraceae bacterium]